MEYDNEKAKGILDRSFTSVKLAFHKECSSTAMLNKCRENVWGEVAGNYEYFLADGTGTHVHLKLILLMDPRRLYHGL